VIRFGTVVAVVLVAMGLLVGGVLANSLLLVYLAIGVAVLAAVMLAIGVVIWRKEIFGESPALAHVKAEPYAESFAVPSASPAATAGLASAEKLED